MSESFLELNPVEARRLGAVSLINYGKIFFPRTFRQKSPPIHEEISAALYSSARYVEFELFRDAAKTSLLRVFTSQRIAYGISRTIMYVSVSQQHSIFSLRWLKRQIQYNSKWAQTFGLSKGDKWTDEWLEIKQTLVNADGSTEIVIVTVLAMGITGQIRGFNPDDFRPDLIIADDLLDEENTATPQQRKKISDLFFGSLLNSLAPQSEAPWAKCVLLGTPFHREDLLAEAKKDPQWVSRSFGIFDEKGNSRWEDRWPTELMKAAKEAAIKAGRYRLWMREKECQIVTSNEKSIDVTKFIIYDVLPESMDVILSIDPASSESEDADDHAIGAIGFRGLDVYILDYKVAKGVMPDKAANDFFELALRYAPRKAAVETISYQRVLKWYIEQEMIKRRIFVTIDAIQDRRKKSDRIMQALPGYVNYGHFHIRRSMTELITQADDYDPSVKDQPDDILDMISTAIIAYNPALRQRSENDIEGEYQRVEEERDYPELEFRGAP